MPLGFSHSAPKRAERLFFPALTDVLDELLQFARSIAELSDGNSKHMVSKWVQWFSCLFGCCVCYVQWMRVRPGASQTRGASGTKQQMCSTGQRRLRQGGLEMMGSEVDTGDRLAYAWTISAPACLSSEVLRRCSLFCCCDRPLLFIICSGPNFASCWSRGVFPCMAGHMFVGYWIVLRN